MSHEPDQPAPAPPPPKGPESAPAAPAPPEAQDPIEPLFVPAPSDPWAHRRVEPRPLALVWTLYLLGACAITLGTLMYSGVFGPDVCRPVTRQLLALVAMGLCVMWPMIRLSQAASLAHPARALVRDAAVLIAPAQMLVWPQGFAWLSAWPWSVVAALSAWMLVWPMLVAGLLAVAASSAAVGRPGRTTLTPTQHAGRAALMLGFLALALAGPPLAKAALHAAGVHPAPTPRAVGADSAGDLSWLASPVFGVFELARERPERLGSAGVAPAHWTAIASVAAAGLLVWIAALWRLGRAPSGQLAPGPGPA